MKQRLTILALTALAVVALYTVFLTVPSPAHAGGATQISGIGSPDNDDGTECGNPEDQDDADFAIVMTGDLEGCHYVTVESYECSPSGTYREWGTEHFVGTYNEVEGTFDTTYHFTSKYEGCAPDGSFLGAEIFGRCQHPLVAGSGEGVFEDVTGRLDFKDDIAAGNFPYRGHLKGLPE